MANKQVTITLTNEMQKVINMYMEKRHSMNIEIAVADMLQHYSRIVLAESNGRHVIRGLLDASITLCCSYYQPTREEVQAIKAISISILNDMLRFDGSVYEQELEGYYYDNKIKPLKAWPFTENL